MNKDKQIEELAETIYDQQSYETYWYSHCESLANDLYNAGYHKASEVAREIFKEIAKIIQHHDELTQRDGSEYGELIVMDIGCAIAELKKKYTEGGE